MSSSDRRVRALADAIHEATRGYLEHDGADPAFCWWMAQRVLDILAASASREPVPGQRVPLFDFVREESARLVGVVEAALRETYAADVPVLVSDAEDWAHDAEFVLGRIRESGYVVVSLPAAAKRPG
jgi:hypothetical protein